MVRFRRRLPARGRAEIADEVEAVDDTPLISDATIALLPDVVWPSVFVMENKCDQR